GAGLLLRPAQSRGRHRPGDDRSPYSSMKETDVTDVRAIPSPTDASAVQQPVESSAGYWRNVWSRLRRDKVTMTVTAILFAIVLIPPLVRISESVTAQVRSLDFVDAAKASGTTTAQIIRHHILANVLGTILVYATSLISVSIVLSAGLSFLGLGAKPPQAE